MGSLTGNPNAIAAFNGQTYPNGLDLTRCQINNELGIWSADPAATFLQGMLVDKGANGITVGTATNVLGIAKWNKTNQLYATVVDEPVTTGIAASVSSLKFANVSNVSVRATTGLSGSVIAAASNYTLSATNGTLTVISAGALVSTTVYVTYTYQVTSAQLDFQGRNFWNFTDDVTIQSNAITVITGPAMIFTTQYDTSQNYTMTGATANVYAGATGLFTSASAGALWLGQVVQVPSATDPYLGIMYTGPVAAIS
jgi:hypothetical protein